MPKISFIEKIWQGYSTDVGKSLIHLGALGWFFSASAQIGMIACNKDINKKEKKFLIPQEISDGTINVVLYYTICQSIKAFFDKFVEKGKILTPNTVDFFDKIGIKKLNKNNKDLELYLNAFKDGNLTNKKNLTSIFEGITTFVLGEDKNLITNFENKYPEITRNIKTAFSSKTNEESVQIIKEAKKHFNLFKNGIGVCAAVGASVLACNIITPIARNISANYFQTKLLRQKQNIHSQNNIISNTYNYTLPHTFNKFKI